MVIYIFIIFLLVHLLKSLYMFYRRRGLIQVWSCEKPALSRWFKWIYMTYFFVIVLLEFFSGDYKKASLYGVFAILLFLHIYIKKKEPYVISSEGLSLDNFLISMDTIKSFEWSENEDDTFNTLKLELCSEGFKSNKRINFLQKINLIEPMKEVLVKVKKEDRKAIEKILIQCLE